MFKDIKEVEKEVIKLWGTRRRANSKMKVFVELRDGIKCRLCDKRRNLQIHHINGIREDNHPMNLITLCASHHKNVGIGNINLNFELNMGDGTESKDSPQSKEDVLEK